ncbi:hypothetical protein FWH30_00885 [Microgenomates group bacterium]|nr:hypothetical protein [Microgenomates group bacterium]
MHKNKLWLNVGAIIVLGLSFPLVVSTFFSDSTNSSIAVDSGELRIEAVLEINGAAGDLVNISCHDLGCNKNDQGLAATMVLPNTIYDFSYTLTNQGTVDYQNNTGDRIAVWMESVFPAATNPMSILLYAVDTDETIINAEVAGMQSGLTTTAPSAISNLDGSVCSELFLGTNPEVDSCLTGILDTTWGEEYLTGESRTYDYKFVLFVPEEIIPLHSEAWVNFGIVSGAKGITAINWQQQLNPYVSAVALIVDVPVILDAGMNRQPFIDQIGTDSASIQDYLAALVTAADGEDGECEFMGSGCTIAIVSDGGFDPTTAGVYEVKYVAENNLGLQSFLELVVEVWDFEKIAGGFRHGIALGSNGSVWTWGYNGEGQRGQGNTNNASTMRAPTQVGQSHFGGWRAIDIAASVNTSCVVSEVGVVYCWGDGANGALGNGSTVNISLPKEVTMPSGIAFTQIAGSQGDDIRGLFVALGDDGDVYVWGNGANYRLGTGSYDNVLVPTKITDNGDFIQVSQGSSSGAALNALGQVYVWGMNGFGQLAQGNTNNSDAITSLPQLVNGLPAIQQLSTGGYSNYGTTLALATNGDVWAWGRSYGVNGNSGGHATTPVKIPAVSNVRQVNSGADFAHYVIGNDLWALGYADSGELFYGNTATHGYPVQSPLVNVVGNVGMVIGGYNNAWILSIDRKTVWGIGANDAGSQRFGSTIMQSGSINAVVPWTFIPASAP